MISYTRKRRTFYRTDRKPRGNKDWRNSNKLRFRRRNFSFLTGKPNPGSENLFKTVEFDEVVSKIVGQGPLSRPKIVSLIWNYSKKNNLQKPGDGRYFIVDSKLADLFEVAVGQTVMGFTTMKFIEKHLNLT